MRARVTARIASSVGRGWLPGILAFGRYSGRLRFGISSGANMPVTRRQREILDYIDEHIKDGDYVVVQERNQADAGQTVIALVHGEGATVKRYFREPGGWIRLQPANESMQPLRINERDVIVQGVVVGVIRKY